VRVVVGGGRCDQHSATLVDGSGIVLLFSEGPEFIKIGTLFSLAAGGP